MCLLQRSILFFLFLSILLHLISSRLQTVDQVHLVHLGIGSSMAVGDITVGGQWDRGDRAGT